MISRLVLNLRTFDSSPVNRTMDVELPTFNAISPVVGSGVSTQSHISRSRWLGNIGEPIETRFLDEWNGNVGEDERQEESEDANEENRVAEVTMVPVVSTSRHNTSSALIDRVKFLLLCLISTCILFTGLRRGSVTY